MRFLDRLKIKSEKNINNKKDKNDKNNKSFKYLDNLIHSGNNEIVLKYDIQLKSSLLNNEEKIYSEGIEVDIDNLIIDGNGHTIDANYKTNIFKCTGKNITIKNVVLKNGFAKPDSCGNSCGGAIRNEGNLHIYNSLLLDNLANRGGAIFNGGELEVVDSTFSNNMANTNGGNRSEGGAISVPNGVLTILNSTFSNNTAENGYGGAIFIANGDFKIQKSTFADNTAENGGAISNHGPYGYVPITTHYDNFFHINESRFFNNSSKNEGGAIFSKNKLSISRSTLFNNNSNNGAVIFAKGHVKIFYCEIFNNRSNKNIITNQDSLQIYNSELINNQSEHVIYNNSILSIFYCELIKNSTSNSILYNGGESCTIEKSTLKNNSSKNNLNIINNYELNLIGTKINDEGISILNHGNITIRNPYQDMLSKIDGEGVAKVKSDVISVEKYDFGYLNEIICNSITNEILLEEDILFEDYELDFYEGGIELDVDNLIIDGNGHILDGGNKSRIFNITGKNITLKNIIFKNGYSYHNYDNSLNNNGGALRINQFASVTIINCEFTEHTTKKYGGAIFNCGEKLSIINSNFFNNKSGADGGAIYNDKSELSISKSNLSNNFSKGSGGAIYNNFANSNISQVKLLHNIACQSAPFGGYMSSGGAIVNEYGKLDIFESIISKNITGCGGAICNNEGDLTIIKSTLSKNLCKQHEGVAIETHEKGLDKIFHFVLKENITPIWFSYQDYLNVENFNSSNIQEVNIKDCIFKNNDHDFEAHRISLESPAVKKYFNRHN